MEQDTAEETITSALANTVYNIQLQSHTTRKLLSITALATNPSRDKERPLQVFSDVPCSDKDWKSRRAVT